MISAAGAIRVPVPHRHADDHLRGGLGKLFDPRDATPSDAAAWIRDHWASRGVRSCAESAIHHGWTVEIRQLDAARGGVRALLLPRLAGGFAVIVDPALAPAERDSGLTTDEVTSWRLAHEYTHTLFYRGVDRPTRRDRASRYEEVFCDAVATALTGICTTSV